MTDRTTSSLYGEPNSRKKEASTKDTISATNLAFTTHLSSLISGESQATKSSPRSLKSKTNKDDIFAVHNKNAQKRAAADLANQGKSGGDAQTHQTSGDIGHVDDATLRRVRRRLEEKARVYDELKKGGHTVDSSDEEDEPVGGDNAERRTRDRAAALRRAEKSGLIDFDRKWVDEQTQSGRKGDTDIDSSEEEDGDDEKEGELIEYVDEFGRTRKGTRADAAQANTEDSPFHHGVTPLHARPARPSNIIHGPTVQAAAFNPDENVAQQMARIAAKRDRTPTPPPNAHYDPTSEVRTRGAGFYAFSQDEEMRNAEMAHLMKEREETKLERESLKGRRDERRKKKEERKVLVEEFRSKRRTEEFLKTLEGEMDGVSKA